MSSRPPTVAPDFTEFLLLRLQEERLATLSRHDALPAERQQVHGRGLELIERIVDELEAGTAPDRATLNLLVYAYADHPDFRAEWNPWHV